jgi:catechol 2,3-dioxygenase-like lactoylglutathione lyase family enzyme
VLHHVTLEIAPADADRFGVLLVAIGFAEEDVPSSLGAGYRWFGRDGTQVHLALTEDPDVPRRGHAAFVARPLEAVVGRLDGLGFEVSERRRHWGARRVAVMAPGGHRVELMEEPPSRRSLS